MKAVFIFFTKPSRRKVLKKPEQMITRPIVQIETGLNIGSYIK